MKKSQAMTKQQINQIEQKKNRQAGSIPILKILAVLLSSMYDRNLLSQRQKMNKVLGLEIAMKKDWSWVLKKNTRFNVTRSSVVEEERRGQITGQRQENRVVHSDR